MRRWSIRLRRVLFGVSCAVVFGSGATQALAAPDPELPPGLACPQSSEPGEPYYSFYCAQGCIEQAGYCGSDGMCHCGYFD
ncbi:MAG TPA: hypothetical protein VFQ76_03145 [Longimicrobiaceae bacterium]|nr:hypothetical protein [Longimicrobiaceae bacterium]